MKNTDTTVVAKKKRWNSKAECEAYLAKHKPTGLRRCAAEDYLNSSKKKESSEGK